MPIHVPDTWVVRRRVVASCAAMLLAIACGGCILGPDGRPLGACAMGRLVDDGDDEPGCCGVPGCGSMIPDSHGGCRQNCCGNGPSCPNDSNYCQSGDGACSGNCSSLWHYACVPIHAAGHCVGDVFNFCTPACGMTGPPPLPPGRFFPVPTRPAFCPRGMPDSTPPPAM